MGNKDKAESVLNKVVDTLSTAIGNIAKKAVMPTADMNAEATAETANEQMYLGDAAIAPEAIPAPVHATRKKISKTKSGKTNKASSAAKKKVEPKAARRRVAKKTRSSAGSKGVGKKKAAKKVAKSTKRRRASR